MIWVDLKNAEVNNIADGVNKYNYSKVDVIEAFSAYSKIDSAVTLLTKRYKDKKISTCVSFRGMMDLTKDNVRAEFDMTTQSLELDRLYCMSFINTNIKFRPIFELHKIQERLFELKAQGLIEVVKLNYTEIDVEELVWKNYLDELVAKYPFDYLQLESDECYEFAKKYNIPLVRSFSSVYRSEVDKIGEIDWSLPSIMIKKERLGDIK